LELAEAVFEGGNPPEFGEATWDEVGVEAGGGGELGLLFGPLDQVSEAGLRVGDGGQGGVESGWIQGRGVVEKSSARIFRGERPG
jgi:hypothetical protein